MAIINTINFLPENFRSTTNQRFLGATMDQLVTDASNIPVNGYIGRKFAPTYKLGDNYVPESDSSRAHYQLEPSVVVKDDKGEVVLNSNYLDLLQSIKNNGGLNNNHSRLFSNTSYNYDGHFDYDKFVNYHNYYWLPDGPAPVIVTPGDTPLLGNYNVTRNTAVDGYTFSGVGGHPDQQLTLARGGTYTFSVNQPGYNFWIQSKPGVTGLDPAVPTINTREVFGVTNNGASAGEITFTVPLKDAQDFYVAMPIQSSVSAAVTFKYSDIQNSLLSDFLGRFPDGLDGITNQLQNKTFIFINNSDVNADWQAQTGIDLVTGVNDIARNAYVPPLTRPYVWKVNLVPAGNDYIIQILPTVAVTPQQKIFITSGKTYASHQFWLDTDYNYQTVPLVTATADYLYYQDSSNPNFVGEIKLVDNINTPIDVDRDIIGKAAYTSPNGIIFTNGLKIQFDSLVTPSSYAGNEYYVEGVGTSIVLVPVSELVIPEPFGANINTTPDYLTINRGSEDRNPWSRSNRWFHKDVLIATAAYNQTEVDYGPNIFGRRAIIEFEPNLQLYNFGRRAKSSVDLITFTATDAFVEIEGPQTYPVNKTVDGVTLTQGMRVIFANDYDKVIENEVWEVDFQTINSQVFLRLIETPDDPVQPNECVTVTQGTTNSGKTFWFDGTSWHTSQIKSSVQQAPLFDLVDASGYSFSDTTVYPGTTFTGTKIFGYPVVAGNNDIVLGFPLTYQNFNNIGDIVFTSYYDAESFTYNGSTTVKNNSGYIVKNNSLTENTKLNTWIESKEPSAQYQIITKFFEGYVLDIATNVEAIYPEHTTVSSGAYAFVQIDALPDPVATVPHLKVYLNNSLLNSNTDYRLINYGVYYVIVLTNMPAVGDKIDIEVLSATTSAIGYYEIPTNLNYNPLNQSFPTVGTVPCAITLGQLRTHYNTLIENTSVSPTTAIPQQDQFLKAQGGTLLQQSSPLVYGMTFLADPVVNYINGITLARKEYQRFKNKFLNLCSTLTGLDYKNPRLGVNTILQNINSVKNISFPWYYSDMIPQGDNYTAISYTVLNSRQNRYEIASIFDITKLSNRAVLVYHNGTQLIANGIDFSFNPSTPEIIINVPLTVGDTIVIYDYNNTDGNYVPETPVKLGLAQAYPPSIYLDTTYQTPTMVIRGHDGSITPAFGDFRDDYLLELEQRIYNNIKIDYNSLNILDPYDTIPGRFRTTDYNLEEWNQLLTQNFLQWAGSNNIDYTTNTWFDANNPWTWNYCEFTDSVDGSFLQGSWRAIYRYWYDTDQPHLAPWEMLGFASEPTWWQNRYGPAPYTNSNTTLWTDLEKGYVWNGSNSAAYVDKRFIRPGLLNFIPVDSAGNLLNPVDARVVRQMNSSTAGTSFQVGQQGPVETAWRRSSDFPYAIQQALALARPAQYFSTQIDLSRFYQNPVTRQFTNVNNQTVSPSLLTVNGDTNSVPGSVLRTAGYLNWIADYIKNLGIDPVSKIESYFKNFNVQLSYRVGGFTDQKLITVTAEQTSPNSTNASVIIPNENYTVYLGKPVSRKKIVYSGVIVTKTETGYSVAGYDTTYPFFTILPSIANNQSSNITIGDITVKVYQTGSKIPLTIPYGTTFASVQQVVDFLVSYQRYLVSQGFIFSVFDTDLGQIRDWTLSANEFMFWSQQHWAIGTILVLNPVFDRLIIQSVGSVVDEIVNTPGGSRLLSTNFTPIKDNNFEIVRTDYPTYPPGNRFVVSTIDGVTGIAFAQLNLISYENTLIFDNIDNFGDILYIPEQGTRQYRLKINGAKTGGWTGALSPAGYVYSNPKINTWQPGVDYRQGDIVSYNGAYYTAPKNVSSSQTFILSDWTRIELSSIQTGLLPSLGHNAQIFQHIYDVDNPPQDKNYQVFSSGLIGFKERPFLSNLGIGISTQTKFYQGYIKHKGTQNAITGLTKSNFDTLSSDIGIYEEWAFRVGQYGGVDSNQYSEFVLDQNVFVTNPVALTTTNNYNTGNIIVNLAVTGNTLTSNVYNSSNISSTSTTLYNNRNLTDKYSTDLPTCGYVNLADVDYQIFDISTVTTMPSTITAGSKIWVAKDINGSWNVYRTVDTGLTATKLTYTLDSYAQVTFNSAHSFSVGNLFVLQNFNSNYNGLYQVVGIPTTTSVTIVLKNTTTLIGAGGTLTGLGSVYNLNSVVVNTYNGSGNPLAGITWVTGDRVWVNTDTKAGATGWAVYTYNGATWDRTRQQSAKVDINSVGRLFIFDKTNNVISTALDFIDPAKGKVLNSVGVDIDYQLTSDPALYNAGTGNIISDQHWGPQQVGKIWWNIDQVRYIDYEQDAPIYRLNRWGTTFPGSQILVYEWVESSVLPSQYVANGGNGIPVHADNSAYSTYGSVGPTGAVHIKYYFWVANKTTINTNAGKLNSVYSIKAAIENPQSQGISYATILRNDTIALYNVNKFLTGQNNVLHIESKNLNSVLIHNEFSLVQEGNPNSKIPGAIEQKLIDSLAGQDVVGNIVPDPTLTPAQAYGIQIRPRQSLFIDKDMALTNYITVVNAELLTYPIVERKLLTTLNSEEPAPHTDSGVYTLVVNSYAELTYIDTTLLSPGYAVLVNNDETNLSKWAVYTWNGSIWSLSRLQSYKTNLYWSKVDWYETGYDYTVAPDVTVNTRIDFGKLTLVPNTHVKILNAGNNHFEVYYIDNNLKQNLVGIEKGTIQISTGTIPSLELRQILLAMQNDILIEDLAVKYNKLFFTMVKYALSEQKNIDWAFKTSFLSATQYIRALGQFPSYIPDNQNYYLDYINEVKPYRTTVREFVVDYQGLDPYNGDVTDFDLKPYYDANVGYYRSPNGEQAYDAATLASDGYTQWNNNYKYCVVDVMMERSGTGYTVVPQVVITGGGGTGAEGYATINGRGGIDEIIITNCGTGYTSVPTVIINGVGSGATARAILRNVFDGNNTGHNLIRSIETTLKFDRVGYTNSNTFVFWDNITTANIGQTIPTNTILVLDSKFYRLSNAYVIDSNVTFPVGNITQVYARDFDNANDRIVAYNGNVDLSLTQSGLNYPGVIVDGNTYIGNNYDALIQSRFTDSIGINPGDIIVDGGQYVDRFESYAPEEFVPGRMYDSLNLIVQDTDHLAFRLFEDMNTISSSYRLASANTTILSANLNLTDTSILVTNASLLPIPNPALNQPGIVFINGEKIIYWRNYALEPRTNWAANAIIGTNTLITYSGNLYLTKGNVYGAYFANIISNVTQVQANTIAQIRRAVDGTSPQLVHVAGSHVVDSSLQQLIPGSANSNVVLTTTQVYSVADTASLGVVLNANISGNIGDVITQTQIIDTWRANTTIAVGQLTYYNGNSYTVTGNVYGATFTNANVQANLTLAFSGNSTNLSTMTLLENVQNRSLVPVVLVSGTIVGAPIRYDSGTVPATTGTYDAFSTDPEYQFGTVANIVSWVPSTSITTWQANTVITTGNLIYYVSPGKTYTVYKVLGNVYGSTFANVSSNVRVVDYVYYSGNTYAALGNIYAPYFANIAGNVSMLASGNTGIPPYNSAITYTGGGDGFDNTVGSIRVNGVDTGAFLTNYYILGKVNSSAQVTMPAGTRLNQSNIWYSPGAGVPTNGLPLVNSTTIQATFLKNSRYY